MFTPSRDTLRNTIVLFAFSLAATTSSLLAEENRITNPGFEDGTTSWSLFIGNENKEKDITFTPVKTSPHSGQQCLALSSQGSGRYGVTPRLNAQDFAPGEHYRISAWVRASDDFVQKPGSAGVYLRATLFSSPGKDAPGGHYFFALPATTLHAQPLALLGSSPVPKAWTQISSVFEIPEGAHLLSPMVFVDGGSGTLFVDDFSLDKVGPEVPLSPLATAPQASTAKTLPAASPERVAAIAKWLSEKPSGIGRPADDRATWDALAALPGAAGCIAGAEKRLNTKPVDYTDEDFLDFTKTGNRDRGQKQLFARSSYLESAILAEALENKGRFIPIIIQGIDAILSEPTWVLPAHDGKLTNFHGETMEVDLGSSMRAYLLATTDYWLGARLPAEVRARIRAEVRRRVLDPYLAFARKGNSPHTQGWWWLTGDNNWNPVCNAGVVGAGLCLLDSKEERALLLACAENSLPHYFEGIMPDGYCTEGMGYWNYGFGRFAMLTELVRHATGGKLDFYQLPKVRAVALYPGALQMAPGVYPTFADGVAGTAPMPWLLDLLERRLKLDRPYWRLSEPNFGSSESIILTAYLDRSGSAPSAAPIFAPHDTFPDSGVFVLRPGHKAALPFTVAFKGGHNAEQHNHNDLGSYAVGVGSSTPLLDPGAENYTARTFSPHRYDSQILSSYGHPVPLVAGKQQSPGRQFQAALVSQEYTEPTDRVVLDLSRGYEVPELRSLQRSFTYSRAGEGELVISDDVAFSSAQSFGTALITTGTWAQTAPDKIQVSDKDATVEVTITSKGAPFAVKAAPLEGTLSSKRTATRIGIDFTTPVEKGTITVQIRPLPPKAHAE